MVPLHIGYNLSPTGAKRFALDLHQRPPGSSFNAEAVPRERHHAFLEDDRLVLVGNELLEHPEWF